MRRSAGSPSAWPGGAPRPRGRPLESPGGLPRRRGIRALVGACAAQRRIAARTYGIGAEAAYTAAAGDQIGPDRFSPQERKTRHDDDLTPTQRLLDYRQQLVTLKRLLHVRVCASL